MKILVTGGAGYIGSFMTRSLLERGDKVVVVDSLERGHKSAIDLRANIILGDLLDKKFITKVLKKEKVDGVIHFAGYISMGESMKNPGLYFEKNIQASVNVADAMVKTDTNHLIFSSTAGVYGNPIKVPIPEDHPKNPENPYGESKLMVEKILSWYGKIFGLSYACLRYFNAAGAALDGSMGERHNPETHLIPKIMEAVLRKSDFSLFGDDYATPDGTCIRDYIHVLDLAKAHILALEKLRKDKGAYTFNIGTGKGHSNREVIAMVEKVTGKKIKVKIEKRRPGDANELVADARQIKKLLEFAPQYSDLETIVLSAWKWHSNYNETK